MVAEAEHTARPTTGQVADAVIGNLALTENSSEYRDAEGLTIH